MRKLGYKALCLCLGLLFLGACGQDEAEKAQASGDADVLQALGVKTRNKAQPEGKEANSERLNMTIAEPDFDRGMTQPEINLEKPKGSSLDF